MIMLFGNEVLRLVDEGRHRLSGVQAWLPASVIDRISLVEPLDRMPNDSHAKVWLAAYNRSKFDHRGSGLGYRSSYRYRRSSKSQNAKLVPNKGK